MATTNLISKSCYNVLLDSIPRLRWSPQRNRFLYNVPLAVEPGANGFVLLRAFEHSDSLCSQRLSGKERHELQEMERINRLIHDVENAVHLHEAVKMLEHKRMHHEEFHERPETDDDMRAQALKKKDMWWQHLPHKRSFEGRRQKRAHVGRVHQPK